MDDKKKYRKENETREEITKEIRNENRDDLFEISEELAYMNYHPYLGLGFSTSNVVRPYGDEFVESAKVRKEEEDELRR